MCGETAALTQLCGDQQGAAGQPRSVVEDHRVQLPCRRIEFTNLPLVDGYPGNVESGAVVVAEVGRATGQQHHVVAPPPQQGRHVHGTLPLREHGQRLVANLPAVAERAVEHGAPPQRRQPG